VDTACLHTVDTAGVTSDSSEEASDACRIACEGKMVGGSLPVS
jgi:hypothetical protein